MHSIEIEKIGSFLMPSRVFRNLFSTGTSVICSLPIPAASEDIVIARPYDLSKTRMSSSIWKCLFRSPDLPRCPLVSSLL